MPKAQPCRNGCGATIVVQLDEASGKWKPFEYKAEFDDWSELHNCPKSPYNQNKGSGFGGKQIPPQPQQRTVPQQINQQYKREPGTPTDIPRHSQGGQALDTKRILQMLLAQDQKLDLILKTIEENKTLDGKLYDNHMSTIYEVIYPFMNTQKTALQIKNEEEQQQQKSVEMVNHSKIADDAQNFLQSKRDLIRKNTKFVDESKEKTTLDERIPDNDEEFAISQALKDTDEDDNGVIEEDI